MSPLSPSESGTATPTLTVANSGSAGNLQYRFQVSRYSSFSWVEREILAPPGTSSTDGVVTQPLAENLTFYWRCRTEDLDSSLSSTWTPTWRFFVNAVNSPPSIPIPTSPPANSQVFTWNPTLTVYNTVDPDANESNPYPLTYEFEVWADPTLSTLVESQAGVPEDPSGFTDHPLTTTLSENTWYYWRVRANDGLISGNWTGLRGYFVTVVNEPPLAPTLGWPLEGATSSSLQPTLYVNNALDPDRDPVLVYPFEVYGDPSLSDLRAAQLGVSGACCTGTTSWWVDAPLQPSHWHWWTSRASDAEFTSPDMPAATFFTPAFPMPEDAEHGYLPGAGGELTRGDRIDYSFPAIAGDVTIAYEVYNVPVGTEGDLRIRINGVDLASQGAAIPSAWSPRRTLVLPDAYVHAGQTNVVSFENPHNLPGSPIEPWGLRQVSVDVEAPGVLSATPYNTTVRLDWTAVSSASGYHVYRSTVSGGPYTKVNPAPLTETSHLDTGLINGTNYYWVVRSEIIPGFEGLPSPEASAMPQGGAVTPVTDLCVTKDGQDVELAWTPITSEPAVQHYRIYEVFPPDFSRGSGAVLGEPATGPWLDLGALTNPNLRFYDLVTVDVADNESP